MDGMVVEGRDYRFTMIQPRESSLVAKRAAFPAKMLQDWVSEHSSFTVLGMQVQKIGFSQ